MHDLESGKAAVAKQEHGWSEHAPTVEQDDGPWRKYRRTGLSEMRPYVPGEDLTGISVSGPDADMLNAALIEGRDPGGYIARNPKNHADQWYVAQAYFDENLEPA